MSIDNNIYILSKGTAPVSKFAIAVIVILVASVIAMVVYTSSKPGRTQEVTAGQELIIGVDRATLYVPKDAAILAGVISISTLKSNLYPIAGEESEWFRSQVVDIQYLNRDGVPYLHVIFPQPVLICFMIKERWQDYTQHPDEYLVQYYAEEQDSPGWVTLPMSANPDRYQLCGQTDHLSIFALALKPQQEEIPITGATLASTPTPTGLNSPTPTGTPNKVSSPASSGKDAVATPVSTQAALTATFVALTATDVPPTATDVPPTAADVPPTAADVPPTATDVPVPDTPVPTDVPQPTEEPTEPPVATEPSVVGP